MPRRRLASLAAAAALLAGCDLTFPWSSETLSVDVSPGALTFVAQGGGAAPAAQTLTVRWEGVELVAGFPPGVTQPGWLDARISYPSAGRATAQIRMTTTDLPVGTYATTLRFVTGDGEGTKLEHRDVQVTYRVVTGYRVSPAEVSLSADVHVAPTPATVTLTSDLPGETWRVEAEGGAPAWLVLPVTSGGFQDGAATVQVGAEGTTAGRHTATLAFRDRSGAVHARVPVTYDVAGQYALVGDLAVTVDEGASLAALELPLTLDTRLAAGPGAAVQWTLASDVPWLTVTPSSGDLSQDVPLVAHLDPGSLWALANGAHTATLTVHVTSGVGEDAAYPLVLTLDLQPSLTLPASVPFSLTSATLPAGLSQAVAVTSNLGEAFAAHGAWHATTGVDWVVPSPASATPPSSLTLTLATEALAPLENGTHQATLALVPDDARIPTATAPVNLTLDLPAIASVTPYTTWVGRSGPVVLRGVGFGAGPTVTLDVGGAQVTGQVVSANEIRADVPAQEGPGKVKIAITNPAGLDRSSAWLAVLPEPSYGAARTALTVAPWAAYQLVLDPERQAVLFPAQGHLHRARWAGGSWGQDDVVIPNLNGVAVAADGETLVGLSSGMYIGTDVHTIDPLTLATGATVHRDTYPEVVNIAAPLAGGRTLLIDSDQWAWTYWYPGFAAGPRLEPANVRALTSRDRTRVTACGSYYNAFYTFDVGAAGFTKHPVAQVPYSATWSMSGDGGRMVAGLAVYDRDVVKLGDLGLAAAPNAVAVSPDGSAAYVLHPDAGGTAWVLERADLTAGAGPYAVTPINPAVAIAWTDRPRAMAVSEDGGTLFLLTYDVNDGAVALYALPL